MIRIEHGATKIECDDPAQAAAFVGLLVGAPALPAAAAPPPIEKARRARKVRAPRQAKAAPSAPPAGTSGSVKTKLYAAIAKNPNPDMKALARDIYGSDTAVDVNRLRIGILGHVKRGGLKALAGGGWKVA